MTTKQHTGSEIAKFLKTLSRPGRLERLFVCGLYPLDVATHQKVVGRQQLD